jgi:hypothetical protein
MQSGYIDAGIASWWGRGHHTDRNLATLLRVAQATGFAWSVYYEAEGLGDPSTDTIRADLTYLRDTYAGDPAYLHIDGRFVVFVYADSSDGCAMASRWANANTVEAFVVLKVFNGYASCAEQPDEWHQYAPAVANSVHGTHSFAISPGFWLTGRSERLPRDLARWRASVVAMNASNARLKLVTTFNEWGEGTSVESATVWASPSGHGAYLDALHDLPPSGTTPPPGSSSTSTVPSTTPTTMTAPSTATPASTAAPPSSTPPTTNGGSGTSTACRQRAVSDVVVDGGYDAFFALGDNQYEDGSLTKFEQSYDQSFGRVK